MRHFFHFFWTPPILEKVHPDPKIGLGHPENGLGHPENGLGHPENGLGHPENGLGPPKSHADPGFRVPEVVRVLVFESRRSKWPKVLKKPTPGNPISQRLDPKRDPGKVVGPRLF